MHITKSLFKEFAECPKLARRHINDKKVYEYINEQLYGGMDAIAIGQEVEDMVARLWDSEKIMEVDIPERGSNDRHNSYRKLTMEVIDQKPEIVYQP